MTEISAHNECLKERLLIASKDNINLVFFFDDIKKISFLIN